MLSVSHHRKHPPCPDGFNLAAYVLSHAADLPDKPALSVVSTKTQSDLTFQQIETAVRGVATGLLSMGLTPGDRVLMRLGNTVEFPLAYLGCIAAGLIAVPTSSMLTEHEVARMCETLLPAAVIHAPDVALGATNAPVVSLNQLRGFFDLPPADYHRGDPNRPAYIIYTSGTSGTPHAVVHAHRAIWARQMMHHDWYGLTQNDRMLHAGAFNWSFTLGAGLLDPWSVGATSVILEPGTEIDALPQILRQSQATIFAAVPGVYRKIVQNHTKLEFPHLRHGLSAGEKLSDSLRQNWQTATGTDLHEAFGMSECSTFVSGGPSRPAQPGTLGYVQSGRHIAIVQNGHPVPLGDTGQIAIHHDEPGLMLGYFDDAGATDSRFDGDWFLTGDLGQMQSDGSITYQGRADDMMNAGGYRVSPIEVEATLSHCKGLTQVGVTDIEIKPGVRVIAAFFTSLTGLSPDTLEAFAKSELARYKQPRLFLQMKTLPVNANGKLARKKLREHYEALHGKPAS